MASFKNDKTSNTVNYGNLKMIEFTKVKFIQLCKKTVIISFGFGQGIFDLLCLLISGID